MDSGDDTAAPCERLEGGGCGLGDPHLRCLPGSGEGISWSDTDTDVMAGRLSGDGCGCAQVGGPLPLATLLVMALLRRRTALFGLFFSARAWGLDVEHLDDVDGGRFVALDDAAFGPAWASGASASGGIAFRPLVLRVGDDRTAILERVPTVALGVWGNVANVTRLGVYVPFHPGVAGADDWSIAPNVAGDLLFRVGVPIASTPTHAASFTVEVAQPLGGQVDLLGGGGYSGTLALERHRRMELAANLGLRLHAPERLPGLVWGNRIEGAFGIATSGPVGAGLEAFGSLPLRTGGGSSAIPLEILATGGGEVGGGWSVRAGVGTGLGHGLGNPLLRAIFDVTFAGDGPEKRPDRPEPPKLAELTLTVRSADPERLDVATVMLADRPSIEVLADERLRLDLVPGRWPLVITADGHHPWVGTLDLDAGRDPIDIVLQPIREGHVEVRADPTTSVTIELDPVQVDDDEVEVADEIRFAFGAATPLSDRGIDALAAWLRDHPEVLVLRIEGHADEIGPSSDNYALSWRRAEAVRDALVARGIEAGRLAPLGTGEARLRGDASASRRVEFLVVVWRDGGPVPER